MVAIGSPLLKEEAIDRRAPEQTAMLNGIPCLAHFKRLIYETAVNMS